MKTAEEISRLIAEAAQEHKNAHGQDAPVLFTFEKGAQFGYKLAASQSKEESPRWVKASERLPNITYNFFVKAIRVDNGGTYNDTSLFKPETGKFYDHNRTN